ncbi:hypothetical protein FACS189426_13440 [Bacteroidia bacterium]|nr:hypothetical protein FACS189426_13440 [Bacteroidia bacterium]
MQILNILSEFLVENYKWLITVLFSGGMVAIVKFVFFNKKEIIRVTRYERENSSIILEFYHEGKIKNENITIGLELYWFHFKIILGAATNASNTVSLTKSDEKSEHLMSLFNPCKIVNITFTPFNPNDKYYILYTTNKFEKPEISNNKSMTIEEKNAVKKDRKLIDKNLKVKNMNMLYSENTRLTKLSEIYFKDEPELAKTESGKNALKMLEEAIEMAHIKIKLEGNDIQ